MDELSFQVSQENSKNLSNFEKESKKESKKKRNTQKSPNKTFEVIGRFKVYTFYDAELDLILKKL